MTLNSPSDSINTYISKSLDYSLSVQSRKKASDKAYLLAQKRNYNSLLYKSLYVKIQNDIEANEDSIDYHFKRLKNIVAKSNSEEFEAGYYSLKGHFSSSQDSCFFYFQKAKDIYVEQKDSVRAGYSLLKLSEIAMEASSFNEVQEFATEAFKYLNKKNNRDYISHLNNMIGLSLANTNDFDEALNYYNQAIKFADTELFKDVIKNNIAKIYQEKKDYQKTIAIYSEMFSTSNLDAHLESKARALDNLGFTYYLNENPIGINYMLKSYKIKDSIKDESGLIASNLNLSRYYLKKNNLLSNQYATDAFTLSKKLKDAESKLKSLELLAKTATTKLQSDVFFSEYIALNDSIKDSKETAKNQFAKLKYDSKEKQEELLKEKAENAENKLAAERATNRSLLAGAILVIMLLSGYLFFKSTQSRNAKEKQKEIYNTETRISKKVHDELANDVYNVMNFANNQTFDSSEKKEILISALDSIYSRTRDISRENSLIDLGENYPLQLKEMLSEYQNEYLNVMIIGNETVNWNSVEENKKTVVFRVLQELMINMKKHSEASLTLIKFNYSEKNVVINYSDNGVGFNHSKTFFKNGLQNVENRIQGINGTITFDKNNSKGVAISITFPA